VPGATVADAVREGYRSNLLLRRVPGSHGVAPIVALEDSSVVVEAVKAADECSGDVIVRCYESLGGRAATRMRTGFAVSRATVADLLKRQIAQLEVKDGTVVTSTEAVPDRDRPVEAGRPHTTTRVMLVTGHQDDLFGGERRACL
jgi:alpha-mannosidase